MYGLEVLGNEPRTFTMINQILISGLHYQKCSTFVKF